MLPDNNINYKKFAVIACDQYTSEPEYWRSLSDYIDGDVSSLNLILPEAYLSELNDEMIAKSTGRCKNTLTREYSRNIKTA